jgi:hypothetical protein
MSEKQDLPVVENEVASTEATQADEQAGFDASFTEARADEAPAEKVEQAEPEETNAEVATEAAPAAEVNATPEEKAGLTADQLTAMLAKLPKIDDLETMTTAELRKVHGKFGELTRTLQELQKSVQNSNKPGLNLSEAKFKRLAEEYPDLAALLSEDLKEIGVANTQQPQSNPEDFQKSVAEVEDKLAKEMQKNLLLIQHKDYPTVVASDEFKVWAQTLPPEEQQELNSTWDAMYLGEKISNFKDWLNKKNSGSQQRQERLQRAVLPQGKQAAPSPAAMTEEDGFALAFKR